MKVPFLDLAKMHKNLQSQLDQKVSRIFRTSAFLGGSETEDFKKLFPKISGAKYTIPCSNGTSALYIALKACGCKPGDEVITVTNTFIATAEALSLAGANIKLIDCDEKTYNMNLDKLEKAVTSRTRFILPVFLYGLPCNMERIMKIARKKKCKVIADACQAHGAVFPYNGKKKKAGTVADMTAFSFYPGKNLGAAGDAGAIATDSLGLAEKALMIANHGIGKNRYYHDMEAFNFRMDNIQAAVLNVKIPHLLSWNKRRNEIAKAYSKAFRAAGIPVPPHPAGFKHSYHLYIIQVKNRDKIQKGLAEQDIHSGIHYPVPIHMQKAYSCLGYKKGDFPVSEKLAKEILSLPIYPEMTDNQVKHVIKNVIRLTGKY